MLTGDSSLPIGLSMRPALANDTPFLETLFQDARQDLLNINGEEEFIQTIMEQQYNVLQEGAGQQYPNAMHFVIEKTQERIGGLIIDFGPNEARVIYLAFIKAAQGKGYGKGILHGLQLTATKAGTPLSLVVFNTHFNAIRLYLSMGFQAVQQNFTHTLMMWLPPQGQIAVGV